MDRHRTTEAEQRTSEPAAAEEQRAEKTLAEQALEALLGAEGEGMLERARAVGKAIERLEGGGLDG